MTLKNYTKKNKIINTEKREEEVEPTAQQQK